MRVANCHRPGTSFLWDGYYYCTDVHILQPLSAFEHPAYKKMINVASRTRDGVTIPSRKVARQEIIGMFNKYMLNLRAELNVRFILPNISQRLNGQCRAQQSQVALTLRQMRGKPIRPMHTSRSQSTMSRRLLKASRNSRVGWVASFGSTTRTMVSALDRHSSRCRSIGNCRQGMYICGQFGSILIIY